MKCIIVALDGSETSRRAAEFAADLAAKFDIELILTSVVEPNWPPEEDLAEYVRPAQSFEAMSQFAENIARDNVKQAHGQALERGAKKARTDVRFGDPADEILKCRAEVGADVIVVGSRGHGRLAGLLLGSVSQKLVSLAPCSVIIVR